MSAPLHAAEERLLVGTAALEITPAGKYPLSGYFHERLATGLKDPLMAKAVVFRQGKDSAVLVLCDLIGVWADLTHEVRKRVEEKLNIPGTRVIIGATHTHTGPDYNRELYSFVTGGSPPTGGNPREPYVPRLIETIVQAIDTAFQSAQPVSLFAGTVEQTPQVAFNRRSLLKSGEVRTWIGLQDPRVLRAAGPIAPDVDLLLMRQVADAKPIGMLSSHALHLDTVGGTEWSADYPFFLERTVRAGVGASCVSLFGNGCCGDINHINPLAKERNSAEFIGTALGQTVVKAVPQLAEVKQHRLQVRQATVRLPLLKSSHEQLEWSRKKLQEVRRGVTVDFFEHVDAQRRIVSEHLQRGEIGADMSLLGWGLSRTLGGSGAELPVDVQTITLGHDVAIVALPGEVFVELGSAIQRASPFKTTFVIELCNQVETFYVPTRYAYIGGGYETTNTTLQPGGGELLAEGAIRLLVESARALQH